MSGDTSGLRNSDLVGGSCRGQRCADDHGGKYPWQPHLEQHRVDLTSRWRACEPAGERLGDVAGAQGIGTNQGCGGHEHDQRHGQPAEHTDPRAAQNGASVTRDVCAFGHGIRLWPSLCAGLA